MTSNMFVVSESSSRSSRNVSEDMYFVAEEDLPVFPKENKVLIWKTSTGQTCLVNIFNVLYAFDKDIIQFDFFISPANICKVSEVVVSNGESILQYKGLLNTTTNSGYGLRLLYCTGIEEIIFVFEDGKCTCGNKYSKHFFIMLFIK